MADPDADYSLLERLNALKATNVTLDRSSNALDVPSSGIEPAAPPSKEDALSARLRTLRNRSQGSAATAAATTTTATTSSPPCARDTSSASAEDPPPPYAEVDGAALPRRQERGEPAQTGRVLDSVAGAGSTGSAPFPGGGGGAGAAAAGGALVDDLDELLGAGASQSLDDILEGLDDVDEDPWPSVPGGDDGDRDDESTRVAELLAKLQDDPPFQVIKADSQEWKKSGGGDEDGTADDSEGELMKREIDNVIAKALDEVHLDETMPEEEKSDKGFSSEADKERKSGEDLSLPSAPTNLRDDNEQDVSTDEETSTDDGDSSEDEDSSEGDSRERAARRKQKGKKRRRKLKLPDAPVRIWDPAVSTEKNFETDIQRRMAFLKRLNDPLEMPSVPTFKPEDKPGKGAP